MPHSLENPFVPQPDKPRKPATAAELLAILDGKGEPGADAQAKLGEPDELDAGNVAEAMQLTEAEELALLEREFNVEAQYSKQVEILRQNYKDIFQEKDGRLIITHEGVDYPMPTKADILRGLREKAAVLLLKKEQGLDKLQITPFALPFSKQIHVYSEALKRHAREKKLYTRKFDPATKSWKRVETTLDAQTPVWVEKLFNKADETGEMVYNVQRYDQKNHGGTTKSEQAKAGNAWEVLWVESDPIIPLQGHGQSKGRGKKRQQVEAGQSAEQYLELLQTDPQYAHEIGLSDEAWLQYALNRLEEHDEVVDDYQNGGSTCLAVGAYIPAKRAVSLRYWNEDSYQANVFWAFSDGRYGTDGARFAVRG